MHALLRIVATYWCGSEFKLWRRAHAPALGRKHVKPLAVLFLIIFGAVAGQALAEDASASTLDAGRLREGAGMVVERACQCLRISSQQAATARAQPLTRSDCDLAGMVWNDRALVCEEKSKSAARAGDVKGTNPAASSILINIDKSTQKMTVLLDGVQTI